MRGAVRLREGSCEKSLSKTGAGKTTPGVSNRFGKPVANCLVRTRSCAGEFAPVLTQSETKWCPPVFDFPIE